MSALRPTPFHLRTAERNARNAWVERNGFTLARDYGDAEAEALAARFSVVMADISWRWRVMLEGTGAPDAVARLFTKDARRLPAGSAVKALWLNDAAAVRGAGLLARLGDARFLLAAAAPDRDWIFDAAARFDVRADDSISAQGGVALIGPFAGQVLRAAGLDPALEPLAFRTDDWRGLSVTLSRWGEHGGYEVWCEAEDAPIVWDRLFKAGAASGIRTAGLAAMDLLDLERGVARPGRDYRPASDDHGAVPHPASLSLERLIDETHLDFNGRAAWLATRAKVGTSLKGLVFDSEIPGPHSAVMKGGRVVGRTFSSVYSPALRRAIALAQLDERAHAPGPSLFVTLPMDAEAPFERHANVHVQDLPFLPNPDPISP